MKKKIFFCFFIIIPLLLSGCSRLSPLQFNDEKDFEIEIIENGKAIAITGYLGESKDVRIPPEVQQLPVTEIRQYAFAAKNITSVTIPDSVFFIFQAAFSDNPLISVTIGDDVSLGEDVPLRTHSVDVYGSSWTYPSFARGLDDFYIDVERRAGTYTFDDVNFKWNAPDFEESELEREIRTIDKNYRKKKMRRLLNEHYVKGIFSYSDEEYANIAYRSRDYFFTANEYREQKDYTNALEYYEIALSLFDWGAFYYQYGYCLMEMEDYENAEKAFQKAIKRIPHYDPYNIIAPYYIESGKNNIYTFDQNGIARELYFSYYNLACIYSINNRLDDSLEQLLSAIEYGYPYLEHIFSDPDLENLFNSANAVQIKDEINRLYSADSINFVSGKTYVHRPLNDYVIYSFGDDNTIEIRYITSDIENHTRHGTYKITNHNIIIQLTKETGYYGIREEFIREIDQMMVIPFSEILSDDRWEEE